MHSVLAKFSHGSLNASWFWGEVAGKGGVSWNEYGFSSSDSSSQRMNVDVVA